MGLSLYSLAWQLASPSRCLSPKTIMAASESHRMACTTTPSQSLACIKDAFISLGTCHFWAFLSHSNFPLFHISYIQFDNRDIPPPNLITASKPNLSTAPHSFKLFLHNTSMTKCINVLANNNVFKDGRVKMMYILKEVQLPVTDNADPGAGFLGSVPTTHIIRF